MLNNSNSTGSYSRTNTANGRASFLCPLSHDIMIDPVILGTTGVTYERAVIEKWIATNEKNTTCNDPVTGEVLKKSDIVLILNRALKVMIENYFKQSVSGLTDREKYELVLKLKCVQDFS